MLCLYVCMYVIRCCYGSLFVCRDMCSKYVRGPKGLEDTGDDTQKIIRWKINQDVLLCVGVWVCVGKTRHQNTHTHTQESSTSSRIFLASWGQFYYYHYHPSLHFQSRKPQPPNPTSLPSQISFPSLFTHASRWTAIATLKWAFLSALSYRLSQLSLSYRILYLASSWLHRTIGSLVLTGARTTRGGRKEGWNWWLSDDRL